MFMIFGGRGGRNFWIIRIVLVAAVLSAGAVFHYHGAGYWTIRAIYYALIFSFVMTAVWRNKARQRGMGGGGGGGRFGSSPYGGGGMPPPFGGQYPPGPPRQDAPPSVSPADIPPSVASSDATATVQPIPRAVPVPVQSSLLSAPGQQPGWYPDPLDPMARHYWDGTQWSHRLKWDGQTWVPA